MKFINGHWTYETDDWQKEMKDYLGDTVEVIDEEADKYLIVRSKASSVTRVNICKKEGIDALCNKYGNTRAGKALCDTFYRFLPSDGKYGHALLVPSDWEEVIMGDSASPTKIVGMKGNCPKCGELIDFP